MRKLSIACVAALWGAVSAWAGTSSASVSIPQTGGSASASVSFSSAGSYVFDGSTRPDWITGISVSIKAGSNSINLGSGKNTVSLSSGATASVTFTCSDNTSGSARSWTYVISSSSATINVTVNQAAGGGSPAGLPNFVFYQVSGWPSPAFLTSSSSGTSSKTSFKQGDPLFLRYAYINSGKVASASALSVDLYYDGTLLNTKTDEAGLDVGDGHSRWNELLSGNMSAGTHTVRIVLNPGQMIAESNYADNERTISFAVEAAEGGQTTETKNVTVSASGGDASAALSFAKAGTYQFAGSDKPSWITGISASIKSGTSTVNIGSGNNNVSIAAGGTATVTFTASANVTGSTRTWTYVISSSSLTYNVIVTQPSQGASPDAKPDWKPVTKPDTVIVYARLYDKSAGVYLEDADGILAAFSQGGECRGKTTLTDGPAGKLFQLTVGIESSSETGLKLKYWNSSKGVVEIGETFGANSSTIGTIAVPKTFSVGGAVCEFSLAQGWTWVSANAEPADASFASVFKDVSFADDDVIKSSDGSATYYGGTWYPSPASFGFVAGRAYAVKKSTSGSASVKVSGSAAPASVAVASGWNWIGPTASAAVPLDALKHSGGFADDDVISSSGASATYYGGKWYGSLQSLEPGVGYKAKFAKGGTISMTR